MFYSKRKSCSALLVAADRGDRDVVQLLINSGADVNVLDSNKETPLHKACFRGHKNIVETLILNNATIDAKAEDGSTPLYIAALKHHQEVALLLIRSGAAIDSDIALILEDVRLFKQYLDSGLDPNSTIQNGLAKGESYLLTAITAQNLAIVELLLNYGARVNEKKQNILPLHRSSAIGCLDICNLLISHGADVNSRGKYGCTPLYLAAQHKNLDIVSLLITHGADINAENYLKSTPLFEAARVQSLPIVEYLLSHGANVNLRDTEGWTPLLRSLQRSGGDDVISVLIAYGADVNVRGQNGYSPLHIAVAQQNKNIIELLLSSGAQEGLE